MTLAFGDVRIVITQASAFGVGDTGSFGYGLVISLAEDVFVFAGRGFHAIFESADPAEQVLIEGVAELPDDGLRPVVASTVTRPAAAHA